MSTTSKVLKDKSQTAEDLSKETLNKSEEEIKTPVETKEEDKEDVGVETEEVESKEKDEQVKELDVEAPSESEVEEKDEHSSVEPEKQDQPLSDLSEQSEVDSDTVDTTKTTNILNDEVAPESKKNSKGLVLSLLATLVVGGALTGGIIYSRTSLDNRSKAASPEETSIPTPEVTSTPEATPTPEVIDLTEYTINILNGSGVAGQAGVVNDLLELAGFEGMDTGNADSYDYESTEVSLIEGTPKGVFDTIKETLEDDYEVTAGEALDEDSDYDILIVVGKD